MKKFLVAILTILNLLCYSQNIKSGSNRKVDDFGNWKETKIYWDSNKTKKKELEVFGEKLIFKGYKNYLDSNLSSFYEESWHQVHNHKFSVSEFYPNGILKKANYYPFYKEKDKDNYYEFKLKKTGYYENNIVIYNDDFDQYKRKGFKLSEEEGRGDFVIEIECDEKSNCKASLIITLRFKEVSKERTIAYNKTSQGGAQYFGPLSFSKTSKLAIFQDFIDFNKDFTIETEVVFGRPNCKVEKPGDAYSYLSIILGSKPETYDYGKMFNFREDEISDFDKFKITHGETFTNEYPHKDPLKVNSFEVKRKREGIILTKDDKYQCVDSLDPGIWIENEKLVIKKLGDKIIFAINGKIQYLENFLPYKTNSIILSPNIPLRIGDAKCSDNNFNEYPTTHIYSIIKIIQDDFDIYEKNISQNKVSKWKGNGSGLIISNDGYVVTNSHVVEGMNEIELEFKYNKQIKSFHAEVVKLDEINDLAIIKINDVKFNKLYGEIPYFFKTRSSEVGTKIYAYGYPMALNGMGKEVKVTKGMINAKTGFNGQNTTYTIDAAIQAGNSGGPLFDDKCNFIGINSSGLAKNVADNVGYTIKSSIVANFIDVLPEVIQLPSSTSIKSKPLTEQIKILSNYVVLIKVR